MIEACFLYKSLYTSLCVFEHNLAHREGIQIFGLLFDLRISLSVLLLFSGRQILFLTRKPRQLSGEFFLRLETVVQRKCSKKHSKDESECRRRSSWSAMSEYS